MLKNAVETIRPPGVEIFMSPVDTVMNPNYIDYIFHPMDLGTISQKVSSLQIQSRSESERVGSDYDFRCWMGLSSDVERDYPLQLK